MPNDKCPKCGADYDKIVTSGAGVEYKFYRCGSFIPDYKNKGESDICRTRCDLAAAKKELAEIKERHGKLVKAARRVVDQYNNGDRAYGVDEFELRIEMLEKALESEDNNG